MLYTIRTKVVDVFERKVERYLSGVGESATFQEISMGWYVLLDGSYEALFLGDTKPIMKIGDNVKITIEKVNDDKPQGPPKQ